MKLLAYDVYCFRSCVSIVDGGKVPFPRPQALCTFSTPDQNVTVHLLFSLCRRKRWGGGTLGPYSQISIHASKIMPKHRTRIQKTRWLLPAITHLLLTKRNQVNVHTLSVQWEVIFQAVALQKSTYLGGIRLRSLQEKFPLCFEAFFSMYRWR